MKRDFSSQDKVKSWLNAALKKEEESWLSSGKPELIDDYCFSPLAVDAIQVRHTCGPSPQERHRRRTQSPVWFEPGCENRRISRGLVFHFQMIDASLTEFSRVIRDQQKAEGMTAHLEAFVSR